MQSVFFDENILLNPDRIYIFFKDLFSFMPYHELQSHVIIMELIREKMPISYVVYTEGVKIDDFFFLIKFFVVV